MTIPLIEEEAASCDDSLRCSNGSKCVEDRLLENMFTCDCSVIHGNTAYAGRYCEFGATEFCQLNPGELVNYRLSFCVNGGTCMKTYSVATEVEHKGCKCPDGYEGDYCEYIEGSAPRPFYFSSDDGGLGSLGTTMVVVLCICLSLGLFLFYVYRRRRASLKEDAELNRLHLAVHGEGSMPTVESIRNSFDVDGVNSYPVNHSALLRKLAKTGSRDNTPSPTKRSNVVGSGNKPSVVQFDHGSYTGKSVRPYRDADYDSPASVGSRNSVRFNATPDDESDDWQIS